MNGTLHLNLRGVDAPGLVRAAERSGLVDLSAPIKTRLNNRWGPLPAPVSELLGKADSLTVQSAGGLLDWTRRHDSLFVVKEGVEVTPERILEAIADWPFAYVHVDRPNVQWWPEVRVWGCMLGFRDPRLFSARMVDRGPWRVLRRGSLTLLQLCDLEAGEEAALAQLLPGNTLSGPSWRGGHFHGDLRTFRTCLGDWKPSAYDAATRTSIKVVPAGEELTLAQMGVAAGTAVHAVYAEPVERVAVVYMDEASARRQLPELWLRGIEVRTWVGGAERRIDTEYEPPPVETPEWVRRLG